MSTFSSILTSRWITEQNQMKTQLMMSDIKDFTNINYVAGVDISFDKNDPNHICAFLTMMEWNDPTKVIYEDYELGTLSVPYESGFLGFREVPFYVTLFERLKMNHPEYWPDVVLVDGFGILHHRGLGSASHLGIKLNIPTIGIAKTLLAHDGLYESQTKKTFQQKCQQKGDFMELIGQSGQIYGVAFKSTEKTLNPIYITIGHQISLPTAIKIVSKYCQYRIPEPIRHSDIESKKHWGGT